MPKEQKEKAVCVFCGSSSRVDERFKALARETGAVIAGLGWRMVYGGGQIGLMGEAADAAIAAGGSVTGVIPQFLMDLEIAHTGLDVLHVTETMHERQMKMAEMSDGFIVLPGGLGTLAEFFEIITWKQIALHEKPVVLVNADGYWAPLTEMIESALREGFVRKQDRDLFRVLQSPGELEGFFQFRT